MSYTVPRDHPLQRLSSRQTEILFMVGRDGMSWDDIQKVLGISEGTRRAHVERLLKKFNCRKNPRDGAIEIFWRYVAPFVDIENSDLRG